MTQLHEVANPIINLPYSEPQRHYVIRPGEPVRLAEGRRAAVYYYRPPNAAPGDVVGEARDLPLVNDLRVRVGAWRAGGYPGVSRVTAELLQYWARPARERKLFFCQREAAETVIFLTEARADLRQGLVIPRDEPGEDALANGYTSFTRYACKMATGSGKTTVMAMLAAWSILNKVSGRGDARFSDIVLVVCPNLTIRDRLHELDPQLDEQSLYRTRDLVPAHLMSDLRRGRVQVVNWQQLQLQNLDSVGAVGAKVVQRGFESDAALVQRVLGVRVGGKRNILVLNDEAHHAYRVRPDPGMEDEDEEEEELEDGDDGLAIKEATVWVEGLDKIHKQRGINVCVDFSATPYFLSRVGQNANEPFQWIVSDFGLVDAIESGLVKIPQLPVQDPTAEAVPPYFNIWKWISEKKLTRAERGGKRGQISPNTILKYAHVPIAQLVGEWHKTYVEWQSEPAIHPTPPVFIIVCRDTRLARALYEWIAGGDDAVAPPIEDFRNQNGREVTVRVDSKVAQELEAGAKSTEAERLRFILQTVGRTRWPGDVPPPEWLALAEKLGIADAGIPPGRDIRCIISVSMLTEGWDATTVTHIVGLRPFQSQLLCEQVVGRGLRRSRYDIFDVARPEDIPEEVAKVYGVPFEVIPFKRRPANGVRPEPPKRVNHVEAQVERAQYAIEFPRVQGYAYAIKSRVHVDWASVPTVYLNPDEIPPEVVVKGLSWSTTGRPTLNGPGRADLITLENWRAQYRLQQLEYDLAARLAREYGEAEVCEVPVAALFTQFLPIVQRLVREKIELKQGYDTRDVFLNPYYSWIIETLRAAIRPDTAAGEAPELPLTDPQRVTGSTAEVDFWTSRPVSEIQHSHLNYVVLDSDGEQTMAYYLDTHPHVMAFAKNAGLGFTIQYPYNGEYHEYVPDYLVRLQRDGRELGTLILEMKGYADPLREVKQVAAERWVNAVNAAGQWGRWQYRVVYDATKTVAALTQIAEEWG